MADALLDRDLESARAMNVADWVARRWKSSSSPETVRALIVEIDRRRADAAATWAERFASLTRDELCEVREELMKAFERREREDDR